MQQLDLVILALATWYTAWVLTSKAGPWDVFMHFRVRVRLGGMTSCMPCFSVWIAAGLYLVTLTIAQPVVWVLAMAGAANLLHRYTGGSRAD